MYTDIIDVDRRAKMDPSVGVLQITLSSVEHGRGSRQNTGLSLVHIYKTPQKSKLLSHFDISPYPVCKTMQIDEEGVFISNSALELANKNKGNRRTLLTTQEKEDEEHLPQEALSPYQSDDVLAQYSDEHVYQKLVQPTRRSTRNLLALADSARPQLNRQPHTLSIHPLEMKSVVFDLLRRQSVQDKVSSLPHLYLYCTIEQHNLSMYYYLYDVYRTEGHIQNK